MNNPKILHQKFVQLGMMRRKLVNQMLAILPEIYESGIWKKYAFSIYEYAGKFGGLGRSVVEKRLQLEKDLVDKPQLKEAIATVGVHKVAIVARLATDKTDAIFADKVNNMSRSAIQALSKELRQESIITESTIKNCNAEPEIIKIEMDKEMSFMFMKLKKKLSSKLNNRDALRVMLQRLMAAGCHNPQKIKASQNIKSRKNFSGEKIDTMAKTTSYIPAAQRRESLSQTDWGCGYPGCNKPAENFHHRDRFAQSHSHKSIVPLCKVHHEFMHNGLVKNELAEPKNWLMDLKNTVTNPIDLLYRKHRQEAIT